MKHWEYKEYYYGGSYENQTVRDADIIMIGREGWELVTVIGHPVHGSFIYFFKREIRLETVPVSGNVAAVKK